MFKKKNSHHCFGFGVEGSGEIGSVFLLESDTRPERMTRIVLENATRRVIDQNESLLPANVGECECSGDVRADGLDLVRLAPVDVRTPGDTGGVEDVARLHGFDVGDDRLTILKTTGAVSVGDSLRFAELAE